MKRVLGMILALMMIVSIPAAAFAETYDIANGSIDVIADGEGQTVYQSNGDSFTSATDSAPVITGSSNENGIFIASSEGAEANVTLQNVDGVYLSVVGLSISDGETGTYSAGDATITLEGSNTFEDSGYGPVVYIGNNTTTIEGSGSLTATSSGTEIDSEDEEWFKEHPDAIVTAGVLVGSETTLNVESGSVTGINQDQGLPALNPGIGFVEGAKLEVGEGVKVYDANGKDVTEAAVADPTVLNTSAMASIKAQPAVINRMVAGTALQELETVVKDADGNEVEAKVIVEIYQNHFVKITVRTANGFYTELCGRATLKDGALVFLFSGVEYTLTADNVLVLPLRNGGTVEVKLTDEVLEIIRGLF